MLMRIWGDRSSAPWRQAQQWLTWQWGAPALLAVIALAGAAHLWFRTGEYGLGLTNDSLHYLAAATSMADGQGLRDAAGGPYLLFPPLYPLVLAGISRLGMAPVAAAQALNIAAFGLTALLAGLWLRRRVQSDLFAAAVTLMAVIAAPLLNTASYLWSETLFALLIVLSLMQLELYRQRPDGTGGKLALAASASCAGLSAVTRYMGVAAILTGVVLLLATPKLPLRVRLAYAAAYGVAASIPLAAYMARNYAVSGSWIVSPNRDATYTMGDALRDLASGVLRYWQVADTSVAGWPGILWAGATLVALAAIAGVMLYRRRPGAGRARRRAAIPGTSTSLAPALPFAVFAAAYVAILLLVVSDRAAQSIDSRYLMPIVTPLLLAAALLADQMMRIEATGRRAALKWLIIAAIVIAAAFLADEVRRGLSETAAARASGYLGDTYNTAQWRNGATPAYLQGYPLDESAPVYTNHAGRLWWFANLEQRKKTVRAQARDDCPAWLRRALARVEQDSVGTGDDAYIIWFDRREPYRGWCRFADETDTLPAGLERLASFDDGAVFRVRVRPPP